MTLTRGLDSTLPFAWHLTHLASFALFDGVQEVAIRQFGIEPMRVTQPLWMHRRSPACFQRGSPEEDQG